MPSRRQSKCQFVLPLDPTPPSPVPVLPEAAMVTLAELLLEAAGLAPRALEGGGDEQQDHR